MAALVQPQAGEIVSVHKNENTVIVYKCAPGLESPVLDKRIESDTDKQIIVYSGNCASI